MDAGIFYRLPLGLCLRQRGIAFRLDFAFGKGIIAY